MNPILAFASSNRSKIIRIFQLLYALAAGILLLTAWAISSDSTILVPLYQLGTYAGQAAIILFLIVTLPGIAGRFRFKHWLITLGIMFRRHTGLTTFFLTLIHAGIVFFIPTIMSNGSLFEFPSFVLYGVIAFSLFAALAATSNDWSVKTLGPNWKRLHRVVYIIFWLIFLHVAIQGVKVWSFIIGTAGFLEILSLIFDWYQKRQVSLPPSQIQNTSQAKETNSTSGGAV